MTLLSFVGDKSTHKLFECRFTAAFFCFVLYQSLMDIHVINAIVDSVLKDKSCDDLRTDKAERIKQSLKPTAVISMLEILRDDIRKASHRKGRLPSNYFYFWSQSIARIESEINRTLVNLPSK